MLKTFKGLKGQDPKPVGVFMNCGCPEFLEIAGAAGYDFVIIDNEHGGWGCG